MKCGKLNSSKLAEAYSVGGKVSTMLRRTTTKILVIESSPHKNGSSNLLADNFIRGAREAGHTVSVFDAAKASLHPCLGCEVCGMAGPCCQNDDMAGLKEQILDSDLDADSGYYRKKRLHAKGL